MRAESKIKAIILSAGSSSRLGHPKQLVSIEDKPLIRHIVHQLSDTRIDEIYVVTGKYSGEIEQTLKGEKITCIHNANWEEGIGSSIRFGVGEAGPDCTNLLICASDQPLLTGDYISRLLDVHLTGKKPVTASYYSGKPGIPAIFSSIVFPDLSKLSGDSGAKKIIMSGFYDIEVVSFPEGIYDLDTNEDILKFRMLNH